MIVVPFIYFTLLALFMWYKHKAFDIAVCLASVYAVSGFFSILIDVFNLWGGGGCCDEISIGFIPVFSYCILITITILPFYNFRSASIQNIELTNIRLFKIVSYFFILIFVSTVLFTFSTIIEMFQDEDFLAVRSLHYEGYNIIEDLSSKSLTMYFLNFFPYFFGFLSYVALLFYFYSIAYMNNKRWFNILLFLSSFSRVIYSMLTLDRTQIVYWILLFVILYSLFHKQINKKVLLAPIVIILSLILVYFLLITIARFGEKDSGALGGIIQYAGQPFLNFTYFFDHLIDHKPYFFRLFPLYNRYLGDNLTLDEYRDMVTASQGFYVSVFSTFLGDIMIDIGHVGMIIYVILFYVLCRILLHRKSLETIHFSQLLLLLMLICNPLHGVFYYRYFNPMEGFYIVESVILYFLLRYTFTLKQN